MWMNNASLGIYIRQMSFCHNMKETLSSNTFEKVYKWQDICKMYSCIHSNTQLHFYIPHTKESCIKVSKMSLRQISWKKSLERLTGWWLIFHIFISQWMLLQAESCVCVLINIFMCYERSSFQISSLYHLVLRFSKNNVNLCRFMMNLYFSK